MGYSHYVFVGALMHVKTKPITEQVGYWMCENDHRWGRTWYKKDKDFCPTCGKPIMERMVSETKNPNFYDLFPDEWEGRLSGNYEFTGVPRGELLMHSNDGVGVIDQYGREDYGYREILPDDMTRCVNEFNTEYADMIEHLRPQVESLKVFFGVYAYSH